MARKTFTVWLDEESAVTVRKWLQTTGQSLSGWLNGIVCEMADQIKGQPSVMNKPVGEMTLDEFAKVASYWWKRMSEETADDGEVKPSSR